MKLYHELARADDTPLVLAIGFFDGFHRGHLEIVRAMQRLRKPGYRAGALTFRNHPAAFLRPGTEPPLLTSPEERIDLLARAGVEECFIVPFDAQLAGLSAHAFVENVLFDNLRVRGLAVGENFRFGQARAGDVPMLAAEFARRQLPFVSVPNVLAGEERISSTRIRALVGAGEIAQAEALLGHAYDLRGRVTLGAGRGHQLGFPTANVELGTDKLMPPDGVYAALARYDGRDYAALVSIGTNPTFEGARRTVEAWLRDFHYTIYGEELALRELRFVREQIRFENAAALVEQMNSDVAAVAYPAFG